MIGGIQALSRTINKRRAFWLVSAIWAISWSIFSWGDISHGYEVTGRQQAVHRRQLQDAAYADCLTDNGTSWGALVEQLDEGCRLKSIGRFGHDESGQTTVSMVD